MNDESVRDLARRAGAGDLEAAQELVRILEEIHGIEPGTAPVGARIWKVEYDNDGQGSMTTRVYATNSGAWRAAAKYVRSRVAGYVASPSDRETERELGAIRRLVSSHDISEIRKGVGAWNRWRRAMLLGAEGAVYIQVARLR